MFKVNDQRSMKVVVVTHCVLNQNAKLEGIAGWPGVINEVLLKITEAGCGILQIPCPEMLYEGIGRFDKSIEQYDNKAFRDLCTRISEEVIDQIENYLDWGYTVPAILAIDGSPSCGFNLAQSAPEWRGLVAEQNWKKVRYIEQPGILMEIFAKKLKEKELNIPIIGIPEIPELGSLDKTLSQLEKTLNLPKNTV